MGGGYIHWGHIEMMRLTLSRKLDYSTTFARWRINAPYKPITRKGLGQRMGGGKGAIDHYVTPVRYGRLILEVGGKVELGEVEPVLTQLAKKLPFPAEVKHDKCCIYNMVFCFLIIIYIDTKLSCIFDFQVMSRESLAEMQNKYAEMVQNNQNPWTFKRIATGNMLGIRKVLSPFDLKSHGRFTGKFFFPDRI